MQRVSKDTTRLIWGLFALSLSPNVCCDSDEGRESKTPAIADIVTNKEQMSKKLLLVLAASLLLTCYTKEGDVIYETDPDDTAPTLHRGRYQL